MLNNQKIVQWMQLFEETITQQQQYLSQLDDVIGDGDHGNNMVRGMTAVKAAFLEKAPVDNAEAFKVIAMGLLTKVGGASGPLYGTAFLEMSKTATSNKEATLAQLVAAGANGIAKRGGAQLGDKTMLDVWQPLATLIDKTLTAQQIDELVAQTKPLQAKKGRASYLGERSIGHLDPGAVSTGLLFKALLQVL